MVTKPAIPFVLNNEISAKFLSGMTQSDLAEAYGYSRGQIKSLLRRCNVSVSVEEGRNRALTKRLENIRKERHGKPKKSTIQKALPYGIRDLARVAARITKVPLDTLLTGRRGKYYCRIRAAVYHLALPHYSYGAIGRVFDNRDHSTIMHGCDVAADLIETNQWFRELVESIDREARKAKVRDMVTMALELKAVAA